MAEFESPLPEPSTADSAEPQPQEIENESDTREWLTGLAQSLGKDVSKVSGALQDIPADQRLPIHTALLYIARSTELITEEIADLGYLDGAFILRAAIQKCGYNSPVFHEFMEDFLRIETFLGAKKEDLAPYLEHLEQQDYHGMRPVDLSSEDDVSDTIRKRAEGFAEAFSPPVIDGASAFQIKAKAFFDARLRFDKARTTV